MGLLRRLSEGKRIKDGLRGEAVVLSILAPISQAGIYQMFGSLLVRHPHGDSYEADDVGLYVKAGKWPMPGATLPVTIDREKRERVQVVWDEVPNRPKDEIQREFSVALNDDRVRARPLPGHPDPTEYLHDLFSTRGDREGPYVVEVTQRPAT